MPVLCSIFACPVNYQTHVIIVILPKDIDVCQLLLSDPFNSPLVLLSAQDFFTLKAIPGYNFSLK